MTYEHILVPLDGSALAEDVLVVVRSLATRMGAKVTLLHVLERDAPATVHGEHHIGTASDGKTYLATVASRLAVEGSSLEVDVHVHDRGVNDVVAAIDAHAHEYGADLIAMCKHGRSGLRDIFAGGIAQRIMRGGAVPILLRTPRTHPDGEVFEPRDILVPLASDHDAGPSLQAAADIAAAYGARIHLLTVVPSLAEARMGSLGARLLPRSAAEVLEIEAQEASSRLEAAVSLLAERGVEATAEVRHEQPAAAILSAAATLGPGLIVLGTHARTGFDAWLSGSTGHRVIAGSDQTLLLLRDL